jgi:hypothetical protein
MILQHSLLHSRLDVTMFRSCLSKLALYSVEAEQTKAYVKVSVCTHIGHWRMTLAVYLALFEI